MTDTERDVLEREEVEAICGYLRDALPWGEAERQSDLPDLLANDAGLRAERDRYREALEDAADTFAQIKGRTRKYKGTRNHYCKQREMAQAAHDAAGVAEDRARRALEDDDG